MYNEVLERINGLCQDLQGHIYEVEELINLVSKLDSSNEYYYDLVGDLDSLKSDIILMQGEDSYIANDFKYIRRDLEKICGK